MYFLHLFDKHKVCCYKMYSQCKYFRCQSLKQQLSNHLLMCDQVKFVLVLLVSPSVQICFVQEDRVICFSGLRLYVMYIQLPNNCYALRPSINIMCQVINQNLDSNFIYFMFAVSSTYQYPQIDQLYERLALLTLSG